MAKSVFISSTSMDLQEHRLAVDQAIRRLKLRPINMSDFGSGPGGAVGVSLDYVKEADFFIGIIAHRYGYVPEGMEKSVTEQEYDEAIKRRIPRLMYLVEPNYEWPEDYIEQNDIAQRKLTDFKNRINANEVRSFFTTPENLSSQIAIDLANQVNRQRRTRTIFAVLGTLLVVFLLATIVLLSDVGARGEVFKLIGVITATPTPKPSLAEFDVGVSVAYFALPEEGLVDPQEADIVVDQIASRVEADLNEFGNQSGLSIGFLTPSQVGRIVGDTRTEREQHARQIVEDYHSDIVLYGVVRKNDAGFLEVQPEFYVSPETFTEALEVTGSFRLGQEIEVEGKLSNLNNAMSVNRPLSARTAAVTQIFIGLIHYLLEDYESALVSFETALDLPGWEDTEGSEVLYVLLGNSQGKIASVAAQNGDLQVAEHHVALASDRYQQAITLAPDYSRSYTGLASLNYLLWNIQAQNNAEFEVSYLNEALAYLEKANNTLDHPEDIGIRTKELFTEFQINFAQWRFHKDDFSESEIDTIFNNFESVGQQIIRRYDNGRNPSVQELTSETFALFGLADSDRQDCDNAIGQFYEAIRLSPSSRRQMFFYGWIGDCQLQLNQTELAGQAYQQALDIARALEDVSPDQISQYENALQDTRGRG